MSACFLQTFCVLLLLSLLTSGITVTFSNSSKSSEIKCIERERQALLSFKQGLIDEFGMLSTWTNHHNNTDCCKWKHIHCNNETGHVQLLDLHGNGYHAQYLRGAINVTSLINLQYIQHLDLSHNYFFGIYIPDFMGYFTNLRYLSLSNSHFTGRIPSKLGDLSQLRYLDLGANYFWGEIPIQIGNLKYLQYLDLGGFYLSGKIPCQIGNLRKLQYLSLGGNYETMGYNFSNSLSGAIPFKIGNLPFLHTLRLSGNFDIEAKDAQWLSSLRSLTSLQLTSLHNLVSSYQWLQTISKIIPNLTELRLVDCNLLDNDIQSLFHSRSSNNSISLTILDLSSNMLTSSTFQLLFNFSLHLQELYLPRNNISSSSSLCPFFPSLKILDLSYCNLASSIFLGNFSFISKLQELHLQGNSLIDRSFNVSSTSTMNSFSSLLHLVLSDNLLRSCSVFHWLSNFTTNLRTLRLDYNFLEGPIPDEFGKAMNSLQYLYLSDNRLQGNVPSFFGSMCKLQRLDLSNNKLNGEFPSFLQNSSWCSIHIFWGLGLSYNQITGQIPESIRLLSELEILLLEGNSLKGYVTESHLSNFSKLYRLSLSHNSLSLKFDGSRVPPFQLSYLRLASCKQGPSFPSWLQTQSSLILLDISNGGINDSVPEWFWNKLQTIYVLNMAYNNLIGSIPNMQLKLLCRPSINLNSNKFDGKVPLFLLQASELLLSSNNFSDPFSFLCGNVTAANLATLDLSDNQIKGQLPDCWKSVDRLLFLDLTSNQFSGKIPISMGTLVKLEALVLRNNSLMGELPSSLKNCNNLIMMDVSDNMLSGSIPSWVGESLQQLIILIIRGNHFSGNLPLHLCYLKRVQLFDLSRNNLSGRIPTCLNNFTALSQNSINRTETESRVHWYNRTYFEIYSISGDSYYTLHITWMWKGVERSFTNPELILHSIDLSCNNLTGKMPKAITYMLGLVSLNLSRNNLSGEIPSEIGNLRSLESLDISRNQFYGRIPSSISQMDFLQNLDLSQNSLFGRIPLGRHLDTFGASSFEGNIDLCGKQLNKSCFEDQISVKTQEAAVHGEDSVFYEALYMSLGLGFFTGFLGVFGPLLLWQPWKIAYMRFLNRLIDYLLVMVELNIAKCKSWLKD